MKQVVLFLVLILLGKSSVAASKYQNLEEQIEFLTKRDKILSENIANVDTPGYKPRDLIKRSSSGLTMRTTSASHLSTDDGGGRFEIVKSKVHSVKPNGNAVDIEEEMRKKSENSVLLNETITLYNKMRSINKTAITGMVR